MKVDEFVMEPTCLSIRKKYVVWEKQKSPWNLRNISSHKKISSSKQGDFYSKYFFYNE